MEIIEKIQCQAGLAITGAWQGSNRNKLYENLGWESVPDRRFIRRIFQLFKIRTNLTAAYLNDKLPPLRTPTNLTAAYLNDKLPPLRTPTNLTAAYLNDKLPPLRTPTNLTAAYLNDKLPPLRTPTNLTAAYLNDKLPPLRTPTRRNTNPQIYREIRS